MIYLTPLLPQFMTLRRLNLKIQGFPESYAADPFMEEDMVVGEPHPHAVSSSSPPGGMPRGEAMPLTEGSGAPSNGLPPNDALGMLGSPIRSSPITEDPITGVA
jgi:hypothetical protein